MDQNNEPPKIVFEEEEFQRPRSFQAQTPKMVRWVMKYSGGAVKNERQAQYILIGFVIATIILSLLLFMGGNKRSGGGYIDPLDDATLQDNPSPLGF